MFILPASHTLIRCHGSSSALACKKRRRERCDVRAFLTIPSSHQLPCNDLQVDEVAPAPDQPRPQFAVGSIHAATAAAVWLEMRAEEACDPLAAGSQRALNVYTALVIPISAYSAEIPSLVGQLQCDMGESRGGSNRSLGQTCRCVDLLACNVEVRTGIPALAVELHTAHIVVSTRVQKHRTRAQHKGNSYSPCPALQKCSRRLFRVLSS